MTSARKRRQGLTDHDDRAEEYAADEQARADGRFAAWKRRVERDQGAVKD